MRGCSGLTFYKTENNFCVVRIEVRAQRGRVTVVGLAAQIGVGVGVGEWIRAAGVCVNDLQHGPQRKLYSLRAIKSTTAEGIEKDLGSEMIRGIGPTYATTLVVGFGEHVFDV